MRLAAVAVLALVLSGCSGGNTPLDETADRASPQSPAASAGAAVMMDPASGPATVNVTQDVDYDATFKPNVCLAGSCVVGGIGALYLHDEVAGDLTAGQLQVRATPTAPNEVLRVVVGVFESCDPGCTRVADLAAAEGTGDLDLTVPAHDLGPGQRIGVRFMPTAPLAVAFGTAGWTVALSGSLTFEQLA